MSKKVLSVGNCAADHFALQNLIERHFDASVIHADSEHDTWHQLELGPVDLVLVNRILDRDGTEGLAMVKAIKQHPQYQKLPVMLITNYDEVQTQAVELGAERGFGKSQLHARETTAHLEHFLG